MVFFLLQYVVKYEHFDISIYLFYQIMCQKSKIPIKCIETNTKLIYNNNKYPQILKSDVSSSNPIDTLK